MIVVRNRTSKALILFGAMILVGPNCDPGEAAPSGGEEASLGPDATADAALLVDQSNEGEFMGAVDASTDLAVADAPQEATSPAGDVAEETAAPAPLVLQTATFALG